MRHLLQENSTRRDPGLKTFQTSLAKVYQFLLQLFNPQNQDYLYLNSHQSQRNLIYVSSKLKERSAMQTFKAIASRVLRQQALSCINLLESPKP
jgi:hypothetical protein